MNEVTNAETQLPSLEEGQIVSLRQKTWTVTSVSKSKTLSGGSIHKVTVECLSDIGLGRVIDVIWEREVEPQIIEAAHIPRVTGLDSPSRFQAYLDAIRWSSSSLAEGNILQAPFRGGVELEEYQLVPLMRALVMPRVTLLIADDVGLGKTIEAGLVAQELIHTHRAQSILIVCPAHLKSKWADEMADKFGLEFRVIDRDAVLDMRREFGPTVNPWASYPRLITSIDYMKTEHPRRLFEELLAKEQRGKGLKPWDLLILDEAHNAAPAGRGQYVRDSDRTALLRAVADHFEHKLFLTATPHNGYRESFTGLLELLDNLRFSRGTELDRDQLKTVTIRRLKDEIRLPDGSRRFPPRVVLPKSSELQPELYVDLSESEQEIFNLLRDYTQSRFSKCRQAEGASNPIRPNTS
jgi:SNF2 family DNA or RNA helicase